MKKLPYALVWTRLLLGILIFAGSFWAVPRWRVYALTGLFLGLLTDVFDGILARWLGVSTKRLRQLDSAVDLVFYLGIGLALAVQSFGFVREHALQMVLLLGAEALTYLVGYLKFKKEMALYTWGAKLWSVVLVATLAQLIWEGNAPVLFPVCFWLGLVTRAGMLLIVLVLKRWAHDVAGIWVVLKLRRIR